MTGRRRFGMALAFAAILAGGCDFLPRMRSQPSSKPYERDMPAMPANLVPTTGGEVIPDAAKARTLANPVKVSAAAVDAGRTFYGYYCRHCHGERGDSRTPVGDSYLPMPTRLDSPRVQAATDGELYRAMVIGKGHEPVMKSTVPPERRWRIVHYIRTLGR
ncbi:MAG: c-type cytochrome [Armatimonadetes bacterium]|nr:c-type cytochrome [Armatimonadota bacterium]